MLETISGCFCFLCVTVFVITAMIIDYKREKYGLVERAYAFRKRRIEDKKREKAEKNRSI